MPQQIYSDVVLMHSLLYTVVERHIGMFVTKIVIHALRRGRDFRVLVVKHNGNHLACDDSPLTTICDNGSGILLLLPYFINIFIFSLHACATYTFIITFENACVRILVFVLKFVVNLFSRKLFQYLIMHLFCRYCV